MIATAKSVFINLHSQHGLETQSISSFMYLEWALAAPDIKGCKAFPFFLFPNYSITNNLLNHVFEKQYSTISKY